MFGKNKNKHERRKYLIVISADSSASCERELTAKEYELIKGIFDETESRYCGGYIVEVPSDDEIRKLGRDYHEYCDMKYFMTFSAYYNDVKHWPQCLYSRVLDLLVKERILTVKK